MSALWPAIIVIVNEKANEFVLVIGFVVIDFKNDQSPKLFP